MAKGKVLVVDDEIYIVHILDFSFGLADYDVITALSGKQGITKARTEKPDIIVMDVSMLPMDGYEACALLKLDDQTEKIPIILISPTDSVISRQMAFEAGADEVMSKPFSPRKLVAKVSELIGIPNRPW